MHFPILLPPQSNSEIYQFGHSFLLPTSLRDYSVSAAATLVARLSVDGPSKFPCSFTSTAESSAVPDVLLSPLLNKLVVDGLLCFLWPISLTFKRFMC